MKDGKLRELYTHRTGNIPFSLHYTQVPVGDTSALYCHWHAEIEIFYVCEGRVRFWVEEELFILEEGEAILVPPYLLHKAEKVESENCSFHAVVFASNLIEDAFPYPEISGCVNPLLFSGLRSVLVMRREVPWQGDLLFMLERVFQNYQRELKDCALEVCGLLFIIWQRLYSEYSTKFSRDDRRLTNNQEVKKAVEWIHEAYDEVITLDDLAGRCHLSRSYFCRLFKEVYGLKPFEYLNRYRIMQASRLLVCGELKITEISKRTGFNGVSYFNRMFLKYTGMNPSVFRTHNKVFEIKTIDSVIQ